MERPTTLGSVADLPGNDLPPERGSIDELEALAACWLEMSRAPTLDEIEAAALAGLLSLSATRIAYTARRANSVWTISAQVGLSGNIAGVAVPEDLVPYAESLRSGQSVCYENPTEMGSGLAAMMAAIGLEALYAVPIMKADVCVGALTIGHPGPLAFTARDRALVRLFTSHLSALLENRELVQSLETLAESVPAIVLRTEPSGWITWYNHRWYSYTGQTPEEAAGWGWQSAHHPEDLVRVMEEWPRALATEQPIETEFRLRRYDGVYHWHLARVEPLRNDKGVILSWYGTVVDIEAQKQALERSKRVAETLQEAFLPQQLPRRAAMRLDAIYVSAEEDARVGGDWYDAFELPDGRMAFSIGDVTGHGLAASLAVGRLRQAIYTLASQCDSPSEILAQVNRILRAQESETYATALVGFVDAGDRAIRYATAGHPPPIVGYPSGRPMPDLPCDGPPLGVSDRLEVATHDVPVVSGTVVLCYTDGITEYSRDAIEGEAQLRSTVQRLVEKRRVAHPAQFVYQAALGSALPRDDVALLLLQFGPVETFIEEEQLSLSKQWRFHASDAHAAHLARSQVAAYLFEMCGETEEARVSELIVGELLANTVAHAPGLVHLTLEWTGEHFALIVRDAGPGLSTIRSTLPSDLMHEGSRGLFLVQSLAEAVELTESPAGGAELRVILPARLKEAAPDNGADHQA